MNTERKVVNIVPACGCDVLMPMALVYMFYVILHGHLSPGGGFQGGVLAVAAMLLMLLGHDYKTMKNSISMEFMRKTEGIAVLIYIIIGMLGVTFGAQFATNFAFDNGEIGQLRSAGTITWMDEAVGLNVLTGVCVLVLSMVGVIKDSDEEAEDEAEEGGDAK